MIVLGRYHFWLFAMILLFPVYGGAQKADVLTSADTSLLS